MGLSDSAQCGRFLMGAAVLLSLFACERKRPRTTEEVVATAKAVRPADSTMPKAAPMTPVATAAPIAPPKDAALSVLGATNRSSPDTLATWPLKTAEWDSLNAEWERWKSHCSVTNLGRYRLAEGLEKPRLFYRVAAHDSTWTEIDLALPDEEPLWGMQSAGTDLDTVNLDGRGAAELVLRFRPASYGTGSGTVWDHVSVLDVSSTPKLIFRALLAAEDEAFGGYAMMHGMKLEPDEQFTGCKRNFKVRGRELVLGPVRTIGNTKTGECTLTKLPAGRYRYQNGKVFRVGK